MNCDDLADCSMWTEKGPHRYWQAPMRDVWKEDMRRQIAAFVVLEKTGAECVLYEAKRYFDKETALEVRYYMEPMTKRELERRIAQNPKGFAVYAVYKGQEDIVRNLLLPQYVAKYSERPCLFDVEIW